MRKQNNSWHGNEKYMTQQMFWHPANETIETLNGLKTLSFAASCCVDPISPSDENQIKWEYI